LLQPNNLKFDQLENELALKAVAWDFEQHAFVSPSKKEFVWNPDGLEAAVCHKCESAMPVDMKYLPELSPNMVPGDNCSCGIYSTFRWSIVEGYVSASPISAVMLTEAVGKTIIYMDGMRTYQLAIRAVIKPVFTHYVGRDNLIIGAAYQAADYFQVPVIDTKTAFVVMDLWNIFLNDDWHEWYRPESLDVKGMNEADILQYKEMFFARKEMA